MLRDASSKMLPLSESGDGPSKRQEKGKGVPVRGTKKKNTTWQFQELQAAQAAASVLGGRAEEDSGAGGRPGLIGTRGP